MTACTKYISLVLIILHVLACSTNQKEDKQSINKPKNIFGLYSHFVTGYNSHCESVKHTLRLNSDSTFIMRVYCYADPASPFISTEKKGVWTKENDSGFNFTSSDKTSFKVELLNDSTIQITSWKGEKLFDYPYKADTAKE